MFDYIVNNLAGEPGVLAPDPANNFIGSITGVEGRDGAAPFRLSVPTNVETAKVDGWGINIQHNFGESGFGVIANATLVDSDVGYQDLNLGEQFVIAGLSDSANLIAFYDKNGLSVRLAYNWRDDFLAGTGQTNVGAVPPTYVADYEQLDMSASYWFTDQAQIFLDVLNITNETTHVYGRDEVQTLFAAQLGTRYNFGFRYKF